MSNNTQINLAESQDDGVNLIKNIEKPLSPSLEENKNALATIKIEPSEKPVEENKLLNSIQLKSPESRAQVPILTKTKVNQAQTLLSKQKKLFERIDKFLTSNSLTNEMAKLTELDEIDTASLTGEEDDAAKIIVSALNLGVLKAQERLLILNSDSLKSKFGDKGHSLAVELLDKLNYLLFQASNFAASNSIVLDIKDSFKPQPKNIGAPQSGNQDLNKSFSEKSSKAKHFSKSLQPLPGSGSENTVLKQDFPPNTTPVYLSGPISQVITNNSRQKPQVESGSNLRILSKRKIQELVSEIDPNERIEPEVEDLLCDIADEFIESVVDFSCQLAKHRKSNVLEAKDIQLHLEKNWNIRIPGFASEEIRSVRKSNLPASYQQRLGAINSVKNLKRFD